MDIDAPEFIEQGPLLIAGLSDRFTRATSVEIPMLWSRFAAHVGKIQDVIDGPAYGVCSNSDPECGFDYLAGVEVTRTDRLPDSFTHIQLAPQRYAVFSTQEHISAIQEFFYTIFNKYLPESGLVPSNDPNFERYTETFDPASGNGGYEIWVPLSK